MEIESELVLDPTIRPGFQTYTADYESDFGKLEVWACVTSDSFGLTQTGESFTHDGDNEHVIILNRRDLLKLQVLVNQAVELLEKNNVESID